MGGAWAQRMVLTGRCAPRASVVLRRSNSDWRQKANSLGTNDGAAVGNEASFVEAEKHDDSDAGGAPSAVLTDEYQAARMTNVYATLSTGREARAKSRKEHNSGGQAQHDRGPARNTSMKAGF